MLAAECPEQTQTGLQLLRNQGEDRMGVEILSTTCWYSKTGARSSTGCTEQGAMSLQRTQAKVLLQGFCKVGSRVMKRSLMKRKAWGGDLAVERTV